MNEEILYFYKQTSIYTYLGLYKNFANNQDDKYLWVKIFLEGLLPDRVFESGEKG